MALKTITAKFNGKCSKCTSFLAAGSSIKFNTDTRKAECVACPTTPVAAPPKPAKVRVSAAEILVRKAGAESLKEAVYTQWANIRTEMMELAKTFNQAAGVCDKCQGMNLVVTWATLDGPSFTEYGACECKGEYPAKGFAEWAARHCNLPSVFSDWSEKAKDVGSVMAETVKGLATNLEKLTNALSGINAEIEECNALLSVKRGAVVEVVKGRKVPVGTKGEVFWMGGGKFGERLGIKDASGNTFWTAVSNVQVVEAVA